MSKRSTLFDVIFVCVVMSAIVLASTVDGQITFSRDWLAGSGKRSPVTFDRDWLAGSGKRSVGSYPGKVMLPPREAIEELANYLLLQLSDSPMAKMSFMKHLQGHSEA
ncbi:hypothetical protein TCAL_05311 [Tigriopus californicus]|uniref:Uncharacterized protein n=1 Tax=Tigriopus californicus TaxID=6832 RepID=A0A553PHT3_TIGCA|nr:hypothetical protein TCAL_05311 [Tigriopus californicus]